MNLKTSIIYSGQLRAFWDPAKASLKEKQETIASTIADKYIVTLKQPGKSEILEQSILKSLTYAYDFGGIEINTEYEVSLICVFGKRQFSCGSSSLYSGTIL